MEVVDREEWLVARMALLEREKAFTRERDALTAARQALPWVKVEEDYRFEDPRGRVKPLGDLFGKASQLIVSHFMFGADWEEGCPSCSFWADHMNGLLAHLAARDVTYVAVSTADPERLAAYRARMGWAFDWYSARGCSFNADFGVTFEEAGGSYNYGSQPSWSGEAPGVSVFLRRDGAVYHSYSTYGRGLDMLNAAYHYLDITPKGRDEADGPMRWLKRRDAY